MRPEAKISIGMPVYNGEKFIRQAVDSLLAQTCGEFELIISDNASTDQTGAICEAYAERDPRIRYIRQSNNIGPVQNFQFVLDTATAGYFMWAAADDQWDSRWIERLLPVATAYRCIATGVYVPVDSSGVEITHPANARKLQYSGPVTCRRMKFFLEPGLLGKGNPIYGIMPTDVLRDIGVSWLDYDVSGVATVYVYVLLAQMEIRCMTDTRMYKRFHTESLGEQLVAVTRNESYPRRVVKACGNMIMQPIPKQYVKESRFYEKLLLWVLYPVAIGRVFYSAIAWKIYRSRSQ